MRSFLLPLLWLAAVASVAYAPFLSLPLISDTYTQIFLGRVYGAPEGWLALSDDVLYRSRATSLVASHLIDALFGNWYLAHKLLNLAVHIANAWLIFALGRWPLLGYRVTLAAATFFAVYEGHQEAIVWVAALPELLMVLFALLALHAWIAWARAELAGWRGAALVAAAYLLALYSKESAVGLWPVLAWLTWRESGPPSWRAPWFLAGSLAVFSAGYALAIFAAADNHLHLNDGTFSLRAPFWLVLPHSLLRMLWIWGVVALAVAAAWGIALRRRLLVFAVVWMAATLLPYSFLLYMNRVPSRHTYFAAVGLAMLIGLAWDGIAAHWTQRPQWLMPALAAVVFAHNCGYLWVKKLPQYERRAAATENFLRYADQHRDAEVLAVACRGPYGIDVYKHAAAVVFGRPLSQVREAPQAADGFCEDSHP